MRLPASELLLRPGAEGIVLPMLATMGVTVRLKVLSDCRFRERRSTWIGLAGVSQDGREAVRLPPRISGLIGESDFGQAFTRHSAFLAARKARQSFGGRSEAGWDSVLRRRRYFRGSFGPIRGSFGPGSRFRGGGFGSGGRLGSLGRAFVGIAKAMRVFNCLVRVAVNPFKALVSFGVNRSFKGWPLNAGLGKLVTDFLL